MDEVLLCLDRGDASSFTLKLATKGKAVTAKKLLATFCKQHAKKCPADAPLDPAACSLDPEIRDTETVTGGTFFVRCAAVAAAPVPPAPAPTPTSPPRRRGPGAKRSSSGALAAAASYATDKPELVASTVAHFDAHADEIDRLLTEVRRMAQLDDAIDASLATMATPRNLALARARGSSTLRFLELGCGAGVDAAALAAAGEHVLVLATDGAERMCSLTRDRVRAAGALSRVRVQRFELVAGDYGALKRGIGGFDACLLNVAMSYVPWADHGAVYAGLRRVLEPATGLLVLADSDFSERLEPTLVEGAHHERRPFADYDANLKAAGFELVERTTDLVGDDAFFAGVWRCAAPPKSRAAVAAARKPKRRAAPAADIPGLP
ncbi:potassium ion transport [Aureococcus anophagefferens]|nr:potassium ion transport [Aureococcus anophagefferens]